MAKYVLPSQLDQQGTDSGTVSATSPSKYVLPSQADNSAGTDSSAPTSTAMDTAKGFGSGLASGEAALAATPRAIHDAARYGADWLIGQTQGRVENYLKNGSADAIPASVIQQQAQTAGDDINMPSYDQTKSAVEAATGPLYQAKTLPGQVAQKVGEYIPSTIAMPGGAVSRLATAAGSGVGDVAGGAYTQGTWLEPYARTAGAIVGGGFGAGLAHAGESLAPAVSSKAAENAGAKIIQNSATDPEAFRSAVSADPGNVGPSNTLLPGWNETSAQRYKDPGVLDLEKAVQTRNPSAFDQNQYGTGVAQQNAAGAGFVDSLKRPGDPSDVPGLFRSQKQYIENAHDALSARAAAEQDQNLAGLGGDRSASAYGQDIAGELTPQYNDIQGQAKNAASAIGGADRPDVYGGVIRTSAQSAYDTENRKLGDLFKAVPGNVSAPIAPLKQFASSLYENMSPAKAATVSPLESKITGAIDKYPDTVPFAHARDIDTLITSSMRQELRQNGRTPAYARMVQMKGAWEDAISGALDGQHAVEQQAVASGQMAPQDTMAAQLAKLAAERDQFYAEKSVPTARAGAGGGDGSNGVVGSSAISGSSGTQGASGSRFRNVADNQGLQGNAAPSRPISQPDLDALNAAKQGTKDFANTFKKGPVGNILKSDGTSGSYKMPEGAVPDAIFPSGPKGHEAVQAYQKAVGSDATASDALHNYAASTLRKRALNEDGTLDPKKYAQWRNSYDSAYRALPADVQKSFDTAAHAGDALQKFGKFSPKMAPTDVPEMFFAPGKAGAEGVNHLRSLIGADKADPLLSDYAASRVKAIAQNADGSVNQKALDRFTQAHDEALSQFPELKQKLSSISGASQLIGDVAASRTQTLRDFQNSAAKKFLGLDDPSEVRDAVGRMIDGNNVTGLKKLITAVKVDPAAEAGVKRAAAEHLSNKFLSDATQAGTTGSATLMKGNIAKALNQNRAALEQVLDKGQMQGLEMLKNGIESSNLTRDAGRIKGSPNTAADYIRAMKFNPETGERESLFRKLLEGSVAGGEIGGEHGALAGTVLAVGTHVRTALRDAGMRKTYQVVEHAILDPEFMKALMAKAPITPGRGSEITLANRIGRYSAFRGLQAQTVGRQDQNDK